MVITEPSKKQAHASVGSADGTPANKYEMQGYDIQGFTSSDGIQAYAHKLKQTIEEANSAEKKNKPLRKIKSNKRITPLR